MTRYKKLILAGVIATAAIAGGTGAAMAATGGGDAGNGKAKQTESYRTAHRNGAKSGEKGLTNVTKDDGKPGLHKDGTAPNNGDKPETHSYRTR